MDSYRALALHARGIAVRTAVWALILLVASVVSVLAWLVLGVESQINLLWTAVTAAATLGLIHLVFWEPRVRAGLIKPLALRTVLDEINNVDVQQFLGNTLSAMRIFRRNKGRMKNLPTNLHGFPIRTPNGIGFLPRPRWLSQRDLFDELGSCVAETCLSSDRLWGEIGAQLRLFLETKDTLRDGSHDWNPFKLDIPAKLRELERDYPEFDSDRPLHFAELSGILKREGIHVFKEGGMEILSAFVSYTDADGRVQNAVFLHAGAHPAMQEFALAHEMGHWFLHVKWRTPCGGGASGFYLHSSHEWGALEEDADRIARFALFPARYLSEKDIYEGLTDDSLVAEFLEPLSGTDDDRMKRYITVQAQRRIRQFRRYKQTLANIQLPEKQIEQDDVPSVLNYFGDAYKWARVSADKIVVNCSESYSQELAKLGRDEFLKHSPHVLNDLTVARFRESTEKQWGHRINKRKPTFYFTVLQFKDNPEKRAAVYAIPVFTGERPDGSVAIVCPLGSPN